VVLQPNQHLSRAGVCEAQGLSQQQFLAFQNNSSIQNGVEQGRTLLLSIFNRATRNIRKVKLDGAYCADDVNLLLEKHKEKIKQVRKVFILVFYFCFWVLHPVAIVTITFWG
jgi:hypothetical protein